MIIPFDYNSLGVDPNFCFIDKFEIRSHFGYMRFPESGDIQESDNYVKGIGRDRRLLTQEVLELYDHVEESDLPNPFEEAETTTAPVRLGDEWVDRGEDAFNMALMELIDRTPHDPTLADTNCRQPCGWIFNKFSTFANNQQHYVAKSAVAGILPKPLFAGSMRVAPSIGESCPESFVRGYSDIRKVSYALSLNLARFIRHNGVQSRRSGLGCAIGVHLDAEGNPVERNDDYGDEWAFDGRDNWLSQETHETLFGWHRLSTNILSYLTQVERGLLQELCRAAPDIQDVDSDTVDEFFHEEDQDDYRYALDYCEFAWEFSSDDPNRLVDELYPYARRYAWNHVEKNEYRVTRTDEGYSRGVVIRLGSGNQIAFYAKTNRRIRFEYRYRSNRGYTASPLTRKTFVDKQTLTQNMRQLGEENAAVRLNAFFEFIREHRESGVASQRSVADLYLRVLEATDSDVDLARVMLNALATRGCLPMVRGLTRGRQGEANRRLADVRHGRVVRYSNQTNIYLPVEEYRNAVTQLREWGNCDNLLP